MADLRLTLHTDASVPLDECLVGVVTLEAGESPARVSGRLNLVEGDLTVTVTDPAGRPVRCAWPWPVDSMPRWVDLGPGQRLEGAVPLLATDTSAPLFPVAGAYTLVASFDAAPGTTVASAPVMVSRTLAASPERAAALDERAVLQSLLAAAAFAEATSGLEALFAASRVATRVLAGLALDRAAEVIASATSSDAGENRGARDGHVEAEVAAAVASVLPGGVFDADPRRAAVGPLLERGDSVAALLRATPR